MFWLLALVVLANGGLSFAGLCLFVTRKYDFRYDIHQSKCTKNDMLWVRDEIVHKKVPKLATMILKIKCHK